MPLGKYIKEFPPTARLHPFERALLELTVGPGTYERVLGRVEALRKSTVQVRHLWGKNSCAVGVCWDVGGARNARAGAGPCGGAAQVHPLA